MTYVEDYVNRLKQIQAAQIAGQVASRPVSKSEFANLILQKARSDFNVSGPPSMPEEKKKGIGGKIKSAALGVLDILARPSYAFSEASQEAFNNGDSIGDVLKGAGRGITGESKTSFIDVLQQQYKNDVYEDPEYLRLKAENPNEAEWYLKTKQNQAETNPKAIVGGLLVDLTLDPINAVGAGLVAKPLKALKGTKNLAREGEVAEEIVDSVPTSQAPKAPQEVAESSVIPYQRETLKPNEGIKPGTFADVLKARGNQQTTIPSLSSKGLQFKNKQVIPGLQQAMGINPAHESTIDSVLQKHAGQPFNEAVLRSEIGQALRGFKGQGFASGSLLHNDYITDVQDAVVDLIKGSASSGNIQQVQFPRVEGKFGSNRRPPGKMVNGKWVKADYAGSRELGTDSPVFANLDSVYNRDLRSSDFAKLQKARITNETAQVVDQVAKSNPAAVDLITNKNINPLSPVARQQVTQTVDHIVREIKNSIADPAKARAAGKQPRHPILNAPTQNNLSNKLTQAARNQFKAESGTPGVKSPAAPKFIPAVYSRYMDMLKNAEESLVVKARDELDDSFYPRGGIKPDSPYLRLSDVLQALPEELAQKAILGPRQEDKVHVATLLKAVTGNNAALGKIARSNPPLFDAIRNVDWAPLMVKEYATRTIDAANAAEKTTTDVATFIKTIRLQNTSDVSKAAGFDEVVKAGKKEFRKEMPEAKASLYDMLDGLRKSIPNPLPDPVDDIIERGKQKLAAGVFSSGNGQKVAQKPRIDTATSVNDSVLHEDGAVTKDAAMDMVLASKSAESGIFSTVLKWVDPASGYKDLRQLVLKNIGVRRASATTRAHEIIRTFSSVPEKEHMDFWNEVRGFIPPVAHHAQAVEQMQKFIGNMFGESGLADKFAGNTSIARSGLNVDHLNKHMRIVGVKDFKFINEVDDPLKPGRKVRLQGPQILETWKNYTPEDSKSLRVFVYNLSQAVENAMVEYSTYANMGAIWGRHKPANGFVQVDGFHSTINGMYFPQDIVNQIGAMSRGIDEMFEPLGGGSVMQAFDQALRTWKTGVTIYAPSHHIRNMVGDVFMSWLDGVNNPIYYTKAAQVLKANHHRYSDIDVGKNPLSDILGEGRETELISQIIGQKNTRLPKGTRVIAKARIGKKQYPITIDQVYQMGFRHGLFPHSAVLEDLPGSETLMESLTNRFHPGKAGPFAPAKGKIGHAARGLSESREHYVRLAHFMHRIEHTKANSLEELFQKSAEAVRKYHPDGLDLTKTEKQVFRRLIPFYSWNRKAIPLIVEGIVMNPHKILAYPKVVGAIQEGQGQESSIGDPWPDDQLFPDWLSSNVIGPVINPTDGFAKAIARSDSEVGYGIVNPGNPATDLMDQYLNSPVKGIAGSVNPFIRIPAELAFGQEVQTNAPIDDKTEYIDKNVPLLSTISRMTHGGVGTGLVEGGDLKGKETEPFNTAAFINYLTGAGILDTGRYIKGGEFDLKKRLAEEAKKNGSQ